MRLAIFLTITTFSLSACTVENTSRPYSDLPAAVTAAFSAEHPYSKVDHASQRAHSDGSVDYIVPYIRPDGSQGTAIYAPNGATVEDK